MINPYQLTHITQQQQARHAEDIWLYNEYHHVEQVLRKQIVTAVEDSYLAALKNRQTNNITTPINQVVQYLFRNNNVDLIKVVI